jgi:hypothetical protein
MSEKNKIEGQKSLDLATRYMDNAKKELILAKKEGKFYQDTKHVSGACGIAYKGVLVALDGIFLLRGIERGDKRKRLSIEYYKRNLAKIDGKLLDSLNATYDILHLSGYYDGLNLVKAIEGGFEEAEIIIKKLKGML